MNSTNDEEEKAKVEYTETQNENKELNSTITENTTMEVHHHAHHDHGKRNWKSYFWEFLMLFLAVFCGSLAEYQLEHKIEKNRELQYIQSMVEDLQSDTANIRKSIQDFELREKFFDSIQIHFDKLNQNYHASLYKSLRSINGFIDFFPTDRTMQQLKNSGGMRLIRNKVAIDSIIYYDAAIKQYEKGLHVLDLELEKTYSFYLMLIDAAALSKAESSAINIDNSSTIKPFLLKDDKAILGNYYNQIFWYRNIKKITLLRMQNLNRQAIRLIQTLKEEYE